MTREEFKTYQTLTNKFYEDCENLFLYIKKNYVSVLSFDNKSEFCGGDYDNDDIAIIYCYQGHYYEEEREQIYIPINVFFNDPHKWIDEWAKEIIAKKEATKEEKVDNANKVESKFHPGDWGIDNCGYVWQIKEIRDQFYLLEGVEGDESWATIEWVNKNFHLWTIQDAKDGDVLHSIGLHGDCIFIFNGLDKWKFDEPNGDRAVATGYCCLTLSANNMEFGIQGPDCIEVDTVKPTTKEQRDLFFSKMKESGYVWNADKKELNKQTPKNLITQLTDIPEDKCGKGKWSGLTTIQMTDEEWLELVLEKPHYSDDENIQKKFEFAVKMTGIGRVFSAMCKEFNDEFLKRFIKEYFEDNKLWTDYMDD